MSDYPNTPSCCRSAIAATASDSPATTSEASDQRQALLADSCDSSMYRSNVRSCSSSEIDVAKVLMERNDAQDQCARLRVAVYHLCGMLTVPQLGDLREDILRTVLAVRFCAELGDVADELIGRSGHPREG